jgi:hypothetical protein
MAIGRKVGRAVLRNRWKRAIREAFRLHLAALPTAWDLVVTVAREARPQDVERVEEAFLAAAEALAREGAASAPGGTGNDSGSRGAMKDVSTTKGGCTAAPGGGMPDGQATHGGPSEGDQA